MMTPDDPAAFDPDAPVPLPVTDSLDLHAFHPRQIAEVVADYLDQAAARGFREVRLIHGKGIGFQRERVRRILAAHPRVDWFEDAPVDRGHWGATLVRLRPGPEPGDSGDAAKLSPHQR
jgi:DNA-nicking Smr family endonuclease